MLNSEDFVERLQILMDYENLSAAAFAESLDVGRSSISHLMSGRNKPSLEFVMKIIATFPYAELNWLLYGEGNYPKKEVLSDKKKNKSQQAPSKTTMQKELFGDVFDAEKSEDLPESSKIQKVDSKEKKTAR